MLAHSEYLWLLGLAAVVAALFFRAQVSLTGRGRVVIPLLRIGAVVCLVIALCRPISELNEGPARRRAVILLDGSLSIPHGEFVRGRDAAIAAAQAATATGAKAQVLLFARKAVLVDAAADDIDRTRRGSDFKLAQDGTNFETAFAEARAQIDAGEAARIVMLTDGNPTEGNLDQALERMKRASIPVFPSPIKPAADTGVAIGAFEVPERAYAGDTLEMTVRIDSESGGVVKVSVDRESKTIHTENVTVRRGSTTVTVRSIEKDPGLVRFLAHLDPLALDDRYHQDNDGYAVCQVLPVPKILLVTNDSRPDHPLIAALTTQKMAHEIVSPDRFPRQLNALNGYSTVVFDNVEKQRLPENALELLEKYVKECGGGFLMVGGRKSFAAGGYVKTPVERILPVEMPTKGYSVSAAVVVLLDTSGSMTGYPVEQVKLSAKALMRMLQGRMVSVWRFSHGSQEVLPIQLVGQDFTDIDAAIDQIQAGGGTAFQPPLQEAYRILVGSQVQNKYVIILTDGEPADSWGVIELVEFMKDKGIQVSTVGIGNHINPQLLQSMADRGGGRFHKPQSLQDLTDAFRDEASHIVEAIPMVEEPFKPKIVKNHPVVRGFQNGDFPQLTGYMGTTLKDRADMVMESHQHDPVLAIWRYGLGVSGAFTTDIGGAWSKEWPSWAGFTRFVSQMLKATFRANESEYAVRAQIRGQSGDVSVDAVDREGAYLNFQSLFAQIVGPPGTTAQRIDLPQAEPGRYHGTFPAPVRGFYTVQVFLKDRDKAVGAAGAAMSVSPEFQAHPLDLACLERIAAQTQGQVVANPHDLGDFTGSIPTRATRKVKDRWPIFAFLGLLLFFLEVCLRRFGVFQRSSEGADGSSPFIGVAESYLKMAKEFDAKGEAAKAQEHYLKAHSYFLKAKRDDEAKRMWERYRLMEERRGGS